MLEALDNISNIIVNFIDSNFTVEGNQIAIKVVMLLIIILAAVFWYLFSTSQIIAETQKKLKNSVNDLAESMLEQKNKKLNYEYIEKNLIRNGITFKFKWMTPIRYISINFGIALFLGLVLLSFNPIAGLVGLIAGYFLFDIYIWYSNSSDNQDMLLDIKTVFTTLKLQTKAGMYITSALTEAFTVVKNPRLKIAILELSGDIVNNNSLTESLDIFNSKFNNSYIDSLTVIIKQSNESGKASQSFKDIEVQLDEIQSAIVMEEKRSIEMQVMIANMLIYGGIIASILYGTLISILDSGVF